MDRFGLIVATLASIVLLPSRAAPAETFGTAAEIAHVVTAADFDTTSANNTWDYDSVPHPTTGHFLRRSIGPVSWAAGLRLPTGAVVTRLEISGCDFSAVDGLLFALYRSKVPAGTGFETVTPLGSTGAGAIPPCGRFSVSPSPPLVIDNDNATYWIYVGTAPSVSFDSVRVYYRLQVSPAPATATFGDVPLSHPFFQFVEALVRSGITAGCGAGNYCPDAALTRGQMAVFLSKALGLHFAP
jgi:hypothetical protein